MERFFVQRKGYKEYVQIYINGLGFITYHTMTKSRTEGWGKPEHEIIKV
jgi:hypothetical protein